jgi:predicted SAM-dependent methyltransferase
MKKQIIPNLDKLNLGCGTDIREGYINLDFEKFTGIDVIHNLNKLPSPFKPNTFNEIIMQNVLEHLENPYGVMKELWRISKSEALIQIRVPHFSSNNAWGDIQHKRGFNSETFKNKNLSGMFKIINQRITFSHFRFFMRPIAKFNPVLYEKHLAYILPAVDLVIELRAIK